MASGYLPKPTDGFEELRALPDPVRGIDVSSLLGAIDWPSVAASGMRFAYIKATQAIGREEIEDKNFSKYWENARKAGLLRGAYHVFGYCEDPQAQWQEIRKVIPQSPEALPPALVITPWPARRINKEGACARGAGKEEIRARIKNLMNRMEETYKVPPVLHATDHTLDEILGPKLLEEASPWRIAYGLARKPASPWVLWLYTGNGKVSGINGRVDVSILGRAAEDSATSSGAPR